jgi:hypothetical protein
MPAALIDEDHPDWEKLNKAWKTARKPGYVTLPGGSHYRVFVVDDKPKFQPMSDFDNHYGSVSTGSLSNK